MASASIPSVNNAVKDLVLVYTVQLKPMTKAHFSGRMVSIGISEVAMTSVHSEKTHLKKLMKMMMMMVIFIINNYYNYE